MDCKSEVFGRVSELLVHKDSISAQDVMNALSIALADYDVIKKDTEIVPYEDVNERLLKRYFACMLVEGKKKSTVKAYSYALKKFADTLHKTYPTITANDIRYYLATLMERGVSARSAENARSIISAFCQWMFNEGITEKNACVTVKPVKYQDKEKKPFSEVEIDALRAGCAKTRNPIRNRAIIEFLLSSGVRVNELCNLTVADVDFDSKTVFVRNGKGGKDRTTYINSITAHYLRMYLISRGNDGPMLFYGIRNNPLTFRGVQDLITNLGNNNGVDKAHPHRFRRTFATNLAKRGMAIQEIQKILGHTNINTTMEYVALDNTQVEVSYRRHIA